MLSRRYRVVRFKGKDATPPVLAFAASGQYEFLIICHDALPCAAQAMTAKMSPRHTNVSGERRGPPRLSQPDG
jgi:hypothetical protein